jgi:SAM-dependent methyltransferase
VHRTLRRYYPESAYGGFTAVDSTIAFYSRVQALAEDAETVLDVGCGRGAQAEDAVPFRRRLLDLRAPRRRAIGIDVDAAALANPLLDEVRLIEDRRPWPIEDASVDVLVSDFVLEHVADPDGFFGEAARVVRPSGFACIRTVNALSYVGIASRLTPVSLHARLASSLQESREARDVFPTVYRCNTRASLRRALDRHGFDAHVQAHDPEPAYLDRWPALYRFGVLHQRFAPAAFGVVLLAWARRRGEARSAGSV